jgi:formylglycine-generating enzyme required for sulfatase activity/TolB-like protein
MLRIFVFLLLGFLTALSAQDDKGSGKAEKEKAIGEVSGDIKDNGAPWVAVYDFTVSPSLTELGVNGWQTAEKVENELIKNAKYRLVTRAKIAKVLKEQKLSTEGALEPSKFGKMAGADYIVTGQVDLKGNTLSVIAKLINAKDKTGVIEKSFESAAWVGDPKADLAELSNIIGSLAQKLSMSPEEFMSHGVKKMGDGDYDEAKAAFMEASRVSPSAMAGKLIADAETKIQERKKKFGASFEEAGKYYAMAQDEKSSPLPPGELCAKAAAILETLLNDPKTRLSGEELGRVRELLKKTSELKEKLYSGPVPGKRWTVPGTGIDFEPISRGTFRMGSAEEELDNKLRDITISKDFWCGKREISVEEFLFFLRERDDGCPVKKTDIDKEVQWMRADCPIDKEYKPKDESLLKHPVTCVTWRGANMFCRWLTSRERRAKRIPKGYEYRLPTEAEWEYCARAGSKGAYCFGDDSYELDAYGWSKNNSGGKTHPAGEKKPSAWGLFDVHGNVWEWCNDWSGPIIGSEVTDPKGPNSSEDSMKVLRGGSFTSSQADLRCAARYSMGQKDAKNNTGFRIVCGPEI